jgi:hypothetical protein
MRNTYWETAENALLQSKQAAFVSWYRNSPSRAIIFTPSVLNYRSFDFLTPNLTTRLIKKMENIIFLVVTRFISKILQE